MKVKTQTNDIDKDEFEKNILNMQMESCVGKTETTQKEIAKSDLSFLTGYGS